MALLALSLVIWNGSLLAAPSHIKVAEMAIPVLEGWNMHQTAKSDDTLLVRFEHVDSLADDALNLYIKNELGLDMKSIFVNDSTVIDEVQNETHGIYTWKTLTASHTLREFNGNSTTYYVRAFLAELGGKTYYGYARSESLAKAKEVAQNFLNATGPRTHSLTGPDFHGKKYYFGFGWNGNGNEEMDNEVKYDIKHTNDLFTKDIGGLYTGFVLNDENIDHEAIMKHYNDLKGVMTSDDMYVQMSSGHGSGSGLAVGIGWEELRDTLLSLPAKEIVSFTMSCYSGNIVDKMNDSKSTWENWQKIGRTLFVMSSSSSGQESSTGPGTDPDEPNGPNGSAGSAYGWALWKSLIGYADGYVDGVKDGFVDLGEIAKYATDKTQEQGGHTPQVTGAYNPKLVMDKVPTKAFVDSLIKEGSTEGMSDAMVRRLIEKLDASMRVQ